MATLGEDYVAEQARVRELIKVYRELPGGVGNIGAALMEQVLQRADRAAMEQDLPAMLVAYQEMQGCE